MTIVSTSQQSSGGSSITTSALSTTGMTLLVVATANWNGSLGQDDAATPITDSSGNTWTKIGQTVNLTSGANQYGELFYCATPTVSGSHTFTYHTTAPASDFPCIAVLGWDGGSVLDQGSNASMTNSGASNVTSQTTPQVTTTQASELLVSAGSGGGATGVAASLANGGSSSASWTKDQDQFSAAGQPLALGHALVSATGTFSATWGFPSGKIQVGIVSFKASGGGGTTYNLSGSTTQAQSLTLPKQIRPVRSIAQTQALSMVRGVALARTIAQTQALSLRKAVALTRAITQSQALALRQAVARTLSLTQSQALTIVAQKVFLRTVSTTQAQTVALSTAVRHTFSVAVSAVQAQVLSLVAVVSGAPPPVPVAVKSPTPGAGSATSNYADFPKLVVHPSSAPLAPVNAAAASTYPDNPKIAIHPTTPPPPIGTAHGGS